MLDVHGDQAVYEFSSFSAVWLRLPQGVFQWLTVLSYYLFSFELCVQVKTLIQENTLYSVRLGGIQSSHLTETVI